MARHVGSRHFFQVFADLARGASDAARILQRIFAEPHPFTRLLAEITEVERISAQAQRELVAEIDRVTVTPLDREDVHQLASRLGGLVSLLHDTARGVQDLHLTHTREEARALSEVLVRATGSIEKSVGAFKRPAVLVEQRNEMERLSEEGIAIYDRASAALFSGTPDAMDVLRWKDVYDALEHALTQCREVQNMLSSVALENR
ncbi:MAG TPA: DUF47 family protein [Longimicrobiaceae bacterium]|nr:DUF47 family protein [Longimicrobiaceae bacterium]